MNTPDPYRAHLQARGIDQTLVVPDHKGTIVAPHRELSTTAIGGLPRLAVVPPSAPSDAAADIRMLQRVGEGGMGMVWVASQTALGRRVAVKQLRADEESPAAHQQLMREALVNGRLEHPNIAPVHVLGQDDEGRPVLVMKYIEGTPWSEVIEPLYGLGRSAEPELIERELGVLLQVCNAVAFAHARKIIHRDIKPANVMIGTFGEVYLLDWGIAVTTEGDPYIPAAADIDSVAGTPGYMAPEMAAADGPNIGERTDVYLLGAVLHELITGHKRHEAENYWSSLSHAFDSPVIEYPSQVPEELAAISNRAGAAKPADRYPNAIALRDALADFLRHRNSQQLASAARRRLTELHERAQSERVSQAADVHALASEARFGFRLALRDWSDNPSARAGLQELGEVMVDYELRQGNAGAAAAALADLPEDRPQLRERLAALKKDLARRNDDIAALEQIRYDADLNVMAPYRRRMSILFGSVLAVSTGALFLLRVAGMHEAGYLDAIVVMAIFSITVAAGGRFMESQGPNEANRRILYAIGLACAALTLHFGIGMWMRVDFSAALSGAMLVAACVSAMMVLLLDRRGIWTALAFAATAVMIAVLPAYRGLWLAVGCFGAFAAGAYSWRRLGMKPGG